MHSIIIPYKGRKKNLDLCLRSLYNSSAWCNRYDFEVLVVGEADLDVVVWKTGCRHFYRQTTPPNLELYPNETAPFWKTHLLNVGIEAAKGDVLTFLDADAIVGRYFMLGAEFLAGSGLTLLAYRVRIAPETMTWGNASSLFENYESFPKAHEAYGTPEAGEAEPRHPVFGNSQFSIRRDVLGDLRFDERYFGRGYEDLDMMRRLITRPTTNYNAAIMTSADYAMFHIKHPFSKGYGQDRWADRNSRLYHGEKHIWIECSDDAVAARIHDILVALELNCGFTLVDRAGPWRSEVLPGDAVITLEPKEGHGDGKADLSRTVA